MAARNFERFGQTNEPVFAIRPANESDCGTILQFIRELAEYERLLDQAVGTEEDLRRSLFSASPQAEVILAFEGPTPVGFALFFHNYSTFLTRRGLYLEDLFVKPEFRGKGYGKKLLAHLASIARERGCLRLEWAVLAWNQPAIGFYKSIGATELSDWRIYRIAGERLNELSGNA